MSMWLRVLRWSLAVPVAGLGFIVGVVVVTTLWQRFGGNAGMAYTWAVAMGTILGAGLGTLVAPADQRKFASWGFVGAVFSVATIGIIVSITEHAFKITSIYEICGSLLGGGITVRVFQRQAGASKVMLR